MNDDRRFWAKVDKRGANECWEWTGARHWRGHGQAFVAGRLVYAHRYSLAQALGRPIADGLMACHHCDNPPCVNPAHLYEGDAKTNSDDMWRRGRARPGGEMGGGRAAVPTACKTCQRTFKTPAAAGRHASSCGKPFEHGTDRGYQTHRRRKETPCSECHEAHLGYRRAAEAEGWALSRGAA